MLLSKTKIISIICIIFYSIGFITCQKSENKNVAPKNPDSSNVNQEINIEQAKNMLGKNISIVERGKFVNDSLKEIVAGIEYNSGTTWGIKFALLSGVNNNIKKNFETNLLKGSFKECLVKKANFDSVGYSLIYYNSRDYFMGSGGGEIFSYLIDFAKQQVYTAHFFTVPNKPVSLYLSPNVSNNAIRNFLISGFKKDYPELKLVNKDYNLEDIF